MDLREKIDQLSDDTYILFHMIDNLPSDSDVRGSLQTEYENKLRELEELESQAMEESNDMKSESSITSSPSGETWRNWNLDFISDMKQVSKTIDGTKYPPSSFLVVEDPESPSTWHLPVKDPDGKPDHRRMGAAWAALHEGYRGQKYEGPNRQQAISKLRKLYELEEMPLPNSEKARGEGQGQDSPRQGDGGATLCVCPECDYQTEHERGMPCAEMECPKCNVALVGKDLVSEDETAIQHSATRCTLTQRQATELDTQTSQTSQTSQTKEGRRIRSDKVSLLERVAKEFDDLRQALGEFVGWAKYEDDDMSDTAHMPRVRHGSEPAPKPRSEPNATDTILSILQPKQALKAFERASRYGSSFVAFKALDGTDWLLTFTTNAFEDREKEIFTTKSIEDYVARHEDDDIKGEYQFWHLPGTKFGDIRWQGVTGRFLVEAGPFDDTPVGRAFKSFFEAHPNGHPDIAPDGWGCSHKYQYESKDREDGIYDWFDKSETTVLPLDAAANPYTSFTLVKDQGENIMNERQIAALKTIGGDKLVSLVQDVGEKATTELEANVAFKQKQDPLDAIMQKVSAGESLTKKEQSMLSAAIDAAKGSKAGKMPWDENEDDEEEKQDMEDMDEEEDMEEKQNMEDGEEDEEAKAPKKGKKSASESDVSKPNISDMPAEEKEYREAVEDVISGLVEHFTKQISDLQSEVKELSGRQAQVERDDEVKMANMIQQTPAASLRARFESAIGQEDTKVDGRSSYAKDAPRENQSEIAGPTPVGLLNAFITGVDQKRQ